ncbi:MAG TPA: DUF2207 domain-containing protein, partial [Dissulfurispiraceae bacterium]|nr:DUF2207 domain-containing protein [Dissulfurispiraceae bacterium]
MRSRTIPAFIAVIACLVIAVTGLPSDCRAEERILRFDSHVTVHEDTSLTVEETIRVRAEQQEIRQGIYRDFPTTYTGKLGGKHIVGFQVLKVLRDGRTEGWHTEAQGNGVRVYMGRKGVFLDPGEYTYVLVYKTDRQLGFFEDHDELYWNVTGNGWVFPIDLATARVTLPRDASSQVRFTNLFTGPQGAKGKNAVVSRDFNGDILFSTTAPLNPYEGLTIVAGWPKGIVQEPSSGDKLSYLLRDNRGVIIGAGGIVLVMLYFVFMWIRVGKDPEPGTIVPLFSPPDGLSPAAVRFISKMGFDDKTFAAAMIDMAVKGAITIRDDDDSYTVTKAKAGDGKLTPEEKKIYGKLFISSDSLVLETTNHKTIRSAIDAAKDALNLVYGKAFFLTNTRYFVPGLVLSLLAVAVMIIGSGVGEGIFIGIWLSIWSLGVAALVAQMISLWKRVIFGKGMRIVALGGALFFSLFSLPFIGGELLGIYFLGSTTSPWIVVMVIAIVAMNIAFFWLLRAPTRLGRTFLDKIEGFRMFLAVTEKDRLNLLNPPDRTPELFEKYLPYALALDVEQEWAEQFTDVLAKAGEPGTAYSPRWYSGSSWSSSN